MSKANQFLEADQTVLATRFKTAFHLVELGDALSDCSRRIIDFLPGKATDKVETFEQVSMESFEARFCGRTCIR